MWRRAALRVGGMVRSQWRAHPSCLVRMDRATEPQRYCSLSSANGPLQGCPTRHALLRCLTQMTPLPFLSVLGDNAATVGRTRRDKSIPGPILRHERHHQSCRRKAPRLEASCPFGNPSCPVAACGSVTGKATQVPRESQRFHNHRLDQRFNIPFDPTRQFRR